jgi:citrate lyase subunit beta/citryl-CoA lyase
MLSISLHATPRSMLFVSGEQAERFPKAMVAGADVVCIDLEDAVHLERKQVAREQVLGWLSNKQASERPAIALRINGLRTLEGLRDVLALDESGVHLDWLLVPKVEDAADLRALHSWIGPRYDWLTALIETPSGIENALPIAHAGGKLSALMLGGADLAAELGAQFGWDGLLHARGRLVSAAKAAGLQAWDVPHIDLRRPDDLSEETRRVLALGFSCKTAIHPQQIPIIHAAFAPSPDELAWAKALLQAIPDGPTDGAFIFEGRMVDAPVLRKARRIVELSDRLG